MWNEDEGAAAPPTAGPTKRREMPRPLLRSAVVSMVLYSCKADLAVIKQ